MSNVRRLLIAVTALLTVLGTVLVSGAASASPACPEPTALPLVTGLASGSGSAIGPGGALYVTEGATGRVWQVDPRSGKRTTFSSGLPKSIMSIGGAMDIAFLGSTAYVLVTLVGPDVGGTDVDGIYRVDGPDHFTVIADIGAFSLAHPPNTPFFVPTGVQYALDTYRHGFMVTDGHHNRVLRVALSGAVTEQMTFDNIVPTGLAILGTTVFMAEAGPVPHLPENGKIVSFGLKTSVATEVASGARLLVDVEFGRGRGLFALSQGVFQAGNPEGSPADPNTGSLVRATSEGAFTVVKDGLNRPTSLELRGNTAYVVTLNGEIWQIDHIACPPYGGPH
jgi:hypothetical protein